MRSLLPLRWRSRALTFTALVGAAVLSVTLTGLAGASTKATSKVHEMASGQVVGSETGSYVQLFKIGHAQIQGECAGSAGAGAGAKLQVVAVGGSIIVTGGRPGEWWSTLLDSDPETATPDTEAVVFVTSYEGLGGAAQFAVIDANGPSFSGTGGVGFPSPGVCVFTAQVAG